MTHPRPWSAPVARTRLLARLVLAGAALAAAHRCLAQELSGYVELTHTRFRSNTEFPGGASLEFLTHTFLQRYALTYSQRFTPNLRLQAGGVFEWDATRFESDLLDTRTQVRTLRPFFNLRLESAPYLAELAWSRNEEDVDSRRLSPAGRAREVTSATLGWFPDELPRAQLQYFKTDLFDRTRRFEDTTEDRLQLTIDYRPVSELYLYYKGALEDTDDRVNENRIETVSHAGRVTYDDNWWDNRITLSSDYNVQKRSTETRTSGAGEVLFPISPFAGLSVIDDSPDIGTLDPNPALIDANTVAGAGLNLGLPPVGGDDRPRNAGLDFGSETEINTLLVWVDRDLPLDIASAFTWRVYTSEDNLTWTERTPPSSVVFGPFVTRFEIRFPNLTARYIKVVTRPLTNAVPFASNFPVILITELQAVLSRPAALVRGRIDRTSHVYNLSVRARLLDAPALYYELTYFIAKNEPAPKQDTLSNGLFWSQPLGNLFSVAGRIARQDGHENAGERTAVLYSASFTATPAPTCRASLVYSGDNEELPGLTTISRSAFLYGAAQLYPGIDANLSVGRSYIDPNRGTRTDSQLIDAGATLVPHPALTLNFFYSDKADTIRVVGRPERADLTTRSAEAAAAYRPLPALYLFASYRREMRPSLKDRTINDYSIDWSPFPEGNLRLNIAYTESLRSEDNTQETTFTPSVRWSVGPRSWLEASYQKLESDSLVQKITTEIVTATFRTTF